MKNFENLNGALVLVRPDLPDPAMQQGKVGVVTYARESDEIYVGFPGAEGIYKGDDLFQLKEKNELLNELMTNGSTLAIEDYKTLYKMMLLADKGTSLARIHALELAAGRPELWDKALTTSAPAQELEVSRSYAR
jgi:hypothetical protein